MTTVSTLSFPFRKLPPELHLHILHHLQDFPTLQNLIATSHDAYTQYHRFPSAVLCSIIRHLPLDIVELAFHICLAEFAPVRVRSAQGHGGAQAKTLSGSQVQEAIGEPGSGITRQHGLGVSGGQALDYYKRLFAQQPRAVLHTLAETARDIDDLTEWCQQRQEDEWSGLPEYWEGGPRMQRAGGTQWSRPAASIARALWQLSLYVVHMQRERRAHKRAFSKLPQGLRIYHERRHHQAMLRTCGFPFGRLPEGEMAMVVEVMSTLRTCGMEGRLVRALRSEDPKTAEWVPDAEETIRACIAEWHGH